MKEATAVWDSFSVTFQESVKKKYSDARVETQIDATGTGYVTLVLTKGWRAFLHVEGKGKSATVTLERAEGFNDTKELLLAELSYAELNQTNAVEQGKTIAEAFIAKIESSKE
jgi:hypothetical protein